MPGIRLATASPATKGTRKETLEQLEGLARAAGGMNADFLVLPEAYLGGYPRGKDFGCKVGDRTAEGREEFREYFRAAVDLGDVVNGGAGAGDRWVRRELGEGEWEERDGGAEKRVRGDGTREELERIARETGVFIVVGVVERAGGSLYCAVVYVCPRRGVIGKRRKVMPTGMERLIWAQGSPATLKAVSTTVRGIRVNLAAAICWENYMPLLRQSLYQQNINLYLAPTADGRDTWLPLMRTIALEGRCFVVSSNMCVRDREHESRQGRSHSHAGHTPTVQFNGNPFHEGPKKRRNSCMTEEGFEIALPTPSLRISQSHPRRHSIFDEQGNEIIVPGSENRAVDYTRRRSIFDEQGNEIVIPGADPRPGNHSLTPSPIAPNAVVEDHHDDVAPDFVPPNWGVKWTGQTMGEGLSKAKAPQEGKKFISRGGSCIVAPNGDVLAGPQWEDDRSIVYADVDLEDCVRGRLDLDAAGSYSRNDSFKFSVEGLNLDPLPYY
ncbi:carbon-nitrogen hydrolase [Xylariaceae sp. FL1272]|nr:carbon-nitrogen hydrolase [Xylariaceae sp. FL1272]